MLRNLGGGAEQARRARQHSTNHYSSATANGDDHAAAHRSSPATEYARSEPNQSGGD